MERSSSQKVLLVLSILAIIAAAFSLFGALFFSFGAGAIVGAGSEAAELTAETGLTSGDLAGMVGLIGISTALTGILYLIEGILGIRAANNNQKIKPVYYIAIISLVLSAISFIMSLVNGSLDASTIGGSIVGLIVSIFIVWIANNIKKEANL